jgi:hypothetical protein
MHVVPFKDTPGLRRIAASAIEARDMVWVRVLPRDPFVISNGTLLHAGEILGMPRRQALGLVSSGVAELLDGRPPEPPGPAVSR